jgi:hypothetical protein
LPLDAAVIRSDALQAGRFARPLEHDTARPPVPPPLLPAGWSTCQGRGEVFVRDSGGTRTDPAVLLLHGWTGPGRDDGNRPSRGQNLDARLQR